MINDNSMAAYHELRKRLIARVLEPGKRLAEQEWTQKLGMSRVNIRHALARLLGEGLVTKGRKGGYFVRGFTPAEMKEFNEVRMGLESTAARLAVHRANEEEIAELETIARHLELMFENQYAFGAYEADLRFHEMLVKMSHNQKLIELYERANLPLSMELKCFAEMPPEQMRREAGEHRHMVCALRDRDERRLIELIENSYQHGTYEQLFAAEV